MPIVASQVVLVSLPTVGAGALAAVLLACPYPTRPTFSRRIALGAVLAVPLIMFAGLAYLLIGNIDVGLLGNLLMGGIPAEIVSATLSAPLPRGAVAVVLLSIEAKLRLTVSV